MKKTCIAALMAAMLLLAAGCTEEGQDVTPTPAPDDSAVTTPMVQTTPAVEATPSMGGAGDEGQGVMEGIEDFVEGAAVEAEKLPTAIKDAVKGKYPVATIKTVSYATYEDQQTYKIVVENAEDETSEEVYVTADGKILPADGAAQGGAAPSASPDASPDVSPDAGAAAEK